MRSDPLARAISCLGSAANLARILGIRPQAVYQWNQVPAERVIQIERATDGAVTRHELRPDLYPAEDPPSSGQAMTGHPTPKDTVLLTVLLTVAEMAQADAATIAAGTPGEILMENAGAAVVREIRRRWRPRPVAVLCGPGNNGGDGFVIARLLRAQGWPVQVALLGSRGKLKGDAAINAARWDGPVAALGPRVLDDSALVVDALFGAGLARPLEGVPRTTVEAIDRRGLDCVAVDVPSGVHGDTGQVLGAAPRAALTVTFFRKKPGHLLLPGRMLAGEVVVADIGIRDEVLDRIAPRLNENRPALWLERYAWPKLADHKYSRGHAVILGGAKMTGAARLAARAALRIGAGMVTVASPPEAVPIYAAYMPGVLTAPVPDPDAFAALLDDPRKNAALIGPGSGVDESTRAAALAALAAGKATVLDADALTVFQGAPEALFSAIEGPCLMTPHEGEFRRLFPSATGEDKVNRARAAARDSGAVVLLKGADTVVAAPDGRATINANAPADLATAGAGDVLAGLALGLMAQGMTPFDAACAAAWLHGAAAEERGPGLIAEDLPDAVPAVLRQLKVLASSA